MDLSPIERWLTLIHILGALGFMLAHGVAAVAAFRLRREREAERIRAILDLSAASSGML